MPCNANNILHLCHRHVVTPVREPVWLHSARGPHASPGTTPPCRDLIAMLQQITGRCSRIHGHAR